MAVGGKAFYKLTARGKVRRIKDARKQGVSIGAISALTGMSKPQIEKILKS